MEDFNPLLLYAKAIVGTSVNIERRFMALIAKAYEMGFTSVDFDPEFPFVTATGHPDMPAMSYDFYAETVCANNAQRATIDELSVDRLPAYIAEHKTH